MGHRRGSTLLHRQARLCLIEGLDLTFLLGAEHHGVLGRVNAMRLGKEVTPNPVLLPTVESCRHRSPWAVHRGCHENHCSVADCVLLVASCYTAPMLDAVEVALNHISSAVAFKVVRNETLAVPSWRYDRSDPAFPEFGAYCVAIVPLVAGEMLCS
jgi:hypothetical protein